MKIPYFDAFLHAYFLNHTVMADYLATADGRHREFVRNQAPG